MSTGTERFSEEQKSALLRAELPPALDRILGELRDRLLQRTMIWRRICGSIRRYFLPDDILTKTDRMSMAHSFGSAAAVPRSSHR